MKLSRMAVTALVLSLAASLPVAVHAGSSDGFFRMLADEARPLQAPPVADDPLAGIGAPAPVYKSCSISRACGDGNTAACTGSFSCANSQKGVTCDGTEHACPNFCVINDGCSQCNRVLFCSSLRGDCQRTDDGISCNGSTPRFCRCGVGSFGGEP
jgi:hypothetical protein